MKYLVVGLGVTGLSVAEYLHRQGANVTVTDSRVDPPKLAELQTKFPNIPLLLGDIVVPDNITTIISSPGVAVTEPALKAAADKGIPIIGDIELFAQVVDKPVLAVTGSNGKSTVTTLLGLMAQASGMSAGVGGNLGTAALALLNPQHDCYILELSSFQLETLFSLKPLVVTILNVSPDHMDRYEDFHAYQQAKQRIYNNAEFAVFNRADSYTKLPDNAHIPSVSFGLDKPTVPNYGVTQHAAKEWLCWGMQPLMPVTDLAILGAHNVANALAALAMGEIAGFNLEAMLDTLRKFKGLDHRCEKIATANNVLWVNDSKGTNVAASVASLQGLVQSVPGKWVIILGGLGKNADFRPLLEPVQEHCRAAILIGSEQQQLWDLLHEVIPCFKAQDLAEVVKIAAEQARSGDGVLLSPACASWDMFDNYMQRGQLFKEQVLQWIGVTSTHGCYSA